MYYKIGERIEKFEVKDFDKIDLAVLSSLRSKSGSDQPPAAYLTFLMSRRKTLRNLRPFEPQ